MILRSNFNTREFNTRKIGRFGGGNLLLSVWSFVNSYNETNYSMLDMLGSGGLSARLHRYCTF